MWALFYRALMWAGAASIGYFANDIGDGVTRYIPAAESKTTGKIAWYWMVLVLLLIAGIIIVLISLLFPKKYTK